MIYISIALLTAIAFGLTYLAYHRARQAAKFDAAVRDSKDILRELQAQGQAYDAADEPKSWASRQWDVKP